MSPHDAPLNVLIVDDDREMRDSLTQYLTKSGCVAEACPSAPDALSALRTNRPDVLVSDVRMPGMTGIDLLGQLDTDNIALPVVLITAHGDVSMAVEAMRAGAFDFIEKPFQPSRLLDVVQRAAEVGRLRSENLNLRERLQRLTGLDAILLGDCPEMRKLREDVEDAADTQASTLILGETGTGKELVARALHDLGARCAGPFVAVNCAAVPDELFESQMFGHLAGAFTGASKSSPGHFVSASHGTLFLDELCACPLHQQPKLLRALEAREVVPVGSSKPRAVDVRVVSATNDILESRVSEGAFREDLAYRLNTLILRIPPLRARGDDVVLLFRHYLDHFARTYEVDAPNQTGDDVAALLVHDWPGNVRELRHVAERRILAARRGRGSVAEALRALPTEGDGQLSLKQSVERYEKLLIDRALAANAGRMDDAAADLGIARRTLNEKFARYGLTSTSYR